MNIQNQIPKHWTADEFLHWAQAQEGRFELVEGEVVDVMINVTRAHMRLASRLTILLGTRLDPALYDVGSADFGIRVSEHGVRFPDVFVDRFAGGSGKDLAARAPVLLAEILSPSSYTRDFGPKVAEYTALPTLLHSLVLSPDEARVWVWSRNENGAFGEPLLLEDPDASLDLPALGLALPLADLYRGIA